MPEEFADFVDGGSTYDPFNKDVPSYNEVLTRVQQEEALKVRDDAIHQTSPHQVVEPAETENPSKINYPLLSMQKNSSSSRRANNYHFVKSGI